MNIEIKVIPHSEQRYPTVGDWFYTPDGDDKLLCIRVSKMSDRRYEFLVALHELVEVKLCEWGGITQEMVDAFDMEFEKNRHPDDLSEPGDDSSAPYRVQHCIATGIERIVAALLGVSWNEYAKEVESL
jgi:hypothetical protein